MPKAPRIAIAGAGLMGRAHAAAFQACGAEVVAVVDRDRDRARALAATCGAAARTTVEEALREEPDALSICLPHSLHFDAAMAAAAQGVALLIEKPHCTSLAESRALRGACDRHGVLAMAGFTHRFLATSRRLKASLAAGLPTLVTESEYTLDHDFNGAFAVLSDLGEPGHPAQVRRGDMHGKTLVDVELLRAWHQDIIRSN